jgi:hypothetical protein
MKEEVERRIRDRRLDREVRLRDLDRSSINPSQVAPLSAAARRSETNSLVPTTPPERSLISITRMSPLGGMAIPPVPCWGVGLWKGRVDAESESPPFTVREAVYST